MFVCITRLYGSQHVFARLVLFQTCLQVSHEYILTYRNIATYFFQLMHRWSTARKRMRETLTYIHHTDCCTLHGNRIALVGCSVENFDDVNFSRRVCLSSGTLIESQESSEQTLLPELLPDETTIAFGFRKKKDRTLFRI